MDCNAENLWGSLLYNGHEDHKDREGNIKRGLASVRRDWRC
jgi:hypothetical protein